MSRTHHVRFGTSINITRDDIEELPEKLSCLTSILENADIEVEVIIEATCEAGWEASWDDPGGSASAVPVSYDFIGVHISADTTECAKNIEVLMTREQRQAIKEFAEHLIDNRWNEEYEYEALNQY